MLYMVFGFVLMAGGIGYLVKRFFGWKWLPSIATGIAIVLVATIIIVLLVFNQ